MKNVIRVIRNNYKIIIAFVLGICVSVTSVYAVDAYIESKKVSYDNSKSNGSYNEVQSSIDELYERSGIHKEKWVDPVLNGADPVLKSPLIPVEIKSNGDVYYANLNSEWYNYSEKRWANAVLLVDNPSNKNYKVGDHILEDDIESYFVWIPRYQYKIWNMANTEDYNSAPNITSLTNTNYTTSPQNAFNKTRIIDIQFGTAESIPKMTESNANEGEYYTHPAFTLEDKNLSGIWVGKFETGGSINNLIVKPSAISLRNKTVKEFFDSAKSFAKDLDSHMMKNTEWGAVAYLSHSEFGIGTEVNINNASDFYTGYSAAPNTNQSTYPSESADHTDGTTTQPWTPVGYLASTTGNITGVYDMSGGAWEYVAGCIDGIPGNSGFNAETLKKEMEKGYIDKYNGSNTQTSYNKRILGDATGEMGPFYEYYENDGNTYNHSSWYGDWASFVDNTSPWFMRGGRYNVGGTSGQFYFSRFTGLSTDDHGFRLVLAPVII